MRLNFLATDSDWIATYYGKGFLTLEDKQTLQCAFEAGQLRNGKVLLFCNFPTPPAFSPFVSPYKFEGITTQDNFHVSTIGKFTIADFHLDYRPSNQTENWTIYLVNGINIQMADGIRADSIHFGLTNFLFDEPFTLCLQHESDITILSIEPISTHIPQKG